MSVLRIATPLPGDRLGRWLVHANVDHHKSVGREHGAHQRLADFVQVPLHGAEDDLAQHFALLTAGQGRLQDAQGCLHGVAADDQVGQIVLAGGKKLADAVDAWAQALVDAVQRVETLGQRLLR